MGLSGYIEREVLETELTACYKRIQTQKENIEAESMGGRKIKFKQLEGAWRVVSLFQNHINRKQGTKTSFGPLLHHKGELQWMSLRTPKDTAGISLHWPSILKKDNKETKGS